MDTENLPIIIKFLVENRIYSISIIIIWGLGCFGKNNSDEMKDEIKRLNKALEQKERQIQQSSGLLEARYGEFADSISRNNIDKILRSTVKRFPLVESCHLYLYEFQRVKDCVDIKINFLQGYEQERVLINVVKQNYYSIDKKIFHNLREVNKLDFKTNKNRVIKSIYKLYNIIEESELHISMKYRLDEILLYVLCDKMGYDDRGIEKIKEENNIGSFRTGIIGSILLEKGYVYKYKGNKKDKEGRIYFSTPIVLDSEYILSVSIDGRGLNSQEIVDIFQEVVLFTKREYNKIKGDVNYD